MAYYNYHSNIKKKIRECKNPQMLIINQYKYISPCLLVLTDDKCYPIREYRWQEYFEIASSIGIKIQDKREKSDGTFCSQQ